MIITTSIVIHLVLFCVCLGLTGFTVGLKVACKDVSWACPIVCLASTVVCACCLLLIAGDSHE